MQSGIKATSELQAAFNDLVSDTKQRGLIVGIKNEELVPLNTVPSATPDFSSDLTTVVASLTDNEAAYIILRRYPDASDGFVAVTFVPDTAKVRQKMLFASTRLTLVRELGTERFRETLFATKKEELTAEGFKRHDQHEKLVAPLSEEERSLQEAKQAEADASRGTTTRAAQASIGVTFPIKAEAIEALKVLKSGQLNLVQLTINSATEEIELAETGSVEVASLAAAIAPNEPRYSFFRYDHEHQGQQESPVFFIYTCPGSSKPKDRMLYSCSKRSMISVAEENAGLTLDKKIEASDPSDITPSTINDELRPPEEKRAAFSRPKRPGRR